MVIVYNCDERYASVFAVSVLSLFECNKDVEDLTVYLIDNGIKEDSMAKIKTIAQTYQRKIITFPMPDIETLLGIHIAIPAVHRITTYGRLFVASLLPNDVNKVVYVDCDTIFMRSIKPLWEIDLGEYYAGMASDVMCSRYRSLLGISEKGIYFNAGVLLIDLALWRKNNVEEKFMKYLEIQQGYLLGQDQDVLNAVLDGKILCLPCEYNVHSVLFSLPYDDLIEVRGLDWYYTREEVEYAVQNPGIVHFTTPFSIPLRPWCKGCNHPYTTVFLNYREKTPWKDEPLWKDKRSILHRSIHSLYDSFSRIAPKKLYIALTRQFYVVFRPFLFRIKKRKFVRNYLKNVAAEKCSMKNG